MSCATAIAHPNIALAKYWGKLDAGDNLPAVPSVSLTLAGMATRTEVSLEGASATDELRLDGAPIAGRPLQRASRLLDLLWRAAGRDEPRPPALVTSHNDFPTAAGLASSASAFAALAVAGDGAFATGLSREDLSSLARQVSASAGRSLFGGFVELAAGQAGMTSLAAAPIADESHWALRLVVAVTSRGGKAVGSTEGMLRTAATSPLYSAWVASARASCERVRRAVLARDLASLGSAAEQSALTMHATALAADPGILYWNGATLEVMHAVRQMRSEGVEAYFTIDAGPHVKVIVEESAAAEVAGLLAAVPGVLSTIVARPGPGAHLVEQDGQRVDEGRA